MNSTHQSDKNSLFKGFGIPAPKKIFVPKPILKQSPRDSDAESQLEKGPEKNNTSMSVVTKKSTRMHVTRKATNMSSLSHQKSKGMDELFMGSHIQNMDLSPGLKLIEENDEVREEQ